MQLKKIIEEVFISFEIQILKLNETHRKTLR